MSEQAYLLAKAYVGGGQYRSLSSLSPRARKVVRRNLETSRAQRKAGEVPRGFGSSPQQMMGEIRRGPEVKSQTEPFTAPFKGKTVPSRVKNLSFTADTPDSARGVVERTMQGKKVRNKTIVHGGRPSEAHGMTLGGFTMDNPSGGRLVQIASTHRGFNPRMVRHEMEHANAGKRKNRMTSLQLRKNPNRSLQNEEARADAAGAAGGRSPASAYREVFGTNSQYTRRFKELTGAKPRYQSVRESRNIVAEQQGARRGEIPKNALSEPMRQLRRSEATHNQMREQAKQMYPEYLRNARAANDKGDLAARKRIFGGS